MKIKRRIISLFFISIFLTACNEVETKNSTQNSETFEELKDIKIEHIHGMGYAGNNNDLYFAIHDGLVRLSHNKWYKTSENNHDYMGFQAIDEGFYSSGHPEQGSNLKNPLGLIKSSDAGRSFKKLAFYGETDFHYLAAGYTSHTIYVINEMQNTELETGLYYTDDEGENWIKSDMKGVSFNSIGNIATHPTKSNMIGISTDNGLFISDDFGSQFKLISNSNPVTTLQFDENSIYYFSLNENDSTLIKKDLATQKEVNLSIPSEINQDNPVMLIASNPKNRDEITVITYKNDIYQTIDNGTSWKSLMTDGEIK
ncbi:F510_1955 family glycosylhydrolase [Metabacillus sediminilitoris]|uniref:Sialidase n=1 Tax=Metabacillus sediminilitoris TaxID=2567941 RepID=A0A4S4BXX9_9BACI|nr:sialidase [Metabacillus sediminilitoris]QGQ44470.1 sialidase [Metabacillus sediminilitoris]THF80093.1 sialidase [Metabacillus sediminilitoris]